MPDAETLPLNEMKFDQEAVPVHLLPIYPLFAIATGFGYGAVKYDANSWRATDRKPVDLMRTYGSILRHLMKWSAGEELDSDSGLPHLWLAGCQMMILIEHAKVGLSDDTRHKAPALIEMFDRLGEMEDLEHFRNRVAELKAKKEGRA